MAELFAELAGEEFASSYPSVHIMGCKVKKEDMSMLIDIESDEFPTLLPLDELKDKIIQKFGISNIKCAFIYRNFSLTEENFSAFYDAFLELLARKIRL